VDIVRIESATMVAVTFEVHDALRLCRSVSMIICSQEVLLRYLRFVLQ
jgi:hypothetical protein